MIDPSRLSFHPGQPALHLVNSINKASTSRWGGVPKVPAGWVWPTRSGGAPLSFLGQVDLAQSQAVLNIDYLPKDGLLLFFYDAEDQPWGFDPDDRDGWKVEYVPAGTAVAPAHLPDEAHEWDICPLAFRLIETYPEGCPSISSEQELSDEDTDAIMEFVAKRNYIDQPHHQMGGYPDPIQSPDMQAECELASNQVNAGSAEGYSSNRGRALLNEGGAADWRLLLQVDTDDGVKSPGWMWGDSGMLYFWVKEDAARRADFSNAWLVLQCC